MKRLWLIFSLLFFFSCEDKKDTTPPETTITSPSSGSTVNEVVNVTCMSTDNKDVEKVELWIDGVNTGLTDDTEPYSFIWNTTTYKDGEHTLIVRGYDTSDNEGDSPPVSVNVDNTLSVPNPVSIQSVDFSNGGFTIKWTKSTDGDFKSYTLEHSVEPGMEDYGNFFTTDGVNVTNTRMENISPLTYHYFRVTVTDTFLYQTKGAIFTSKLDPIPDSVDVKSVTYDLEKMTVEWEESKEGDFGSYKLLYLKTESGDKDTVETYTDKSTTSYPTSTYDPTIENWYWVMVTDTLGQSKIGNGKANAIDSTPTQSVIDSIVYKNDSFYIYWSQNNDSDFKSYILYESTLEDMSNKDKVYTTDDNTVTSYIVTGIVSEESRYYQLVVEDKWGLQTSSNVIGKTGAVYGCTDPDANNYNSEATVDDESCEYPANVIGVETGITPSLYQGSQSVSISYSLRNVGDATAYNVRYRLKISYKCNTGFASQGWSLGFLPSASSIYTYGDILAGQTVDFTDSVELCSGLGILQFTFEVYQVIWD